MRRVPTVTRRQMLQFAAGTAAFAAGLAPGAAQESRIARSIEAARGLGFVGERIDAISSALVGSPYVVDPLIGGPTTPERLVVRDDAFDCVTFCETVLAASRAFAVSDFVPELRKIRYRDGEIAWRARNHYFADWARNNIANGVCRAVALPDATVVEKTVTYMRDLPVERVALTSIPAGRLLSAADRVATGDIIGFLSRRPGIDYFHIGFIIVDRAGALWLRHAARSKARVLEQRLVQFLAESGVRHVTLLRPQDVWTGNTIG